MARATTLYVHPASEVTLRAGQGTDFRILSMLADGDQVEVLEEQGGWAHVRARGNREGWVLRRYLSERPPLALQVQQLEKAKAHCEATRKALKQQLLQVQEAKAALKTRLEKTEKKLQTTNRQYAHLQVAAKDALQAKKTAAQATEQLQALQDKVDTLSRENKALRHQDNMRWFLAGGGVLLIGWILGRINLKSRRRSSLL